MFTQQVGDFDLHIMPKALGQDSLRRKGTGKCSPYLLSTLAPETRQTPDYYGLPVAQPANETSRGLYDGLVARTGVRTYSAAPLELAHLSTALRAAWTGDCYDWPQDHALGLALEFCVVAWNVKGVERAIYCYHPDEHGLVRIGRAPNPHTDGLSLVLQAEFTTAPVIMMITGNLAAAIDTHGNWGHRQLLFRAGAAANRLWFASLAVGLSGCIFAGFLPRIGNDIAGIDGSQNAGLIAFSVGWPFTGYREVHP